MRDDFGVVIISHQRADDLRDRLTVKTLRQGGYTDDNGTIIVVIDDEDRDLEKYKAYFKNVHVFNKRQVFREKDIDMMDNFGRMESATYARNIVFDVARSYGLKYFCLMDDDIRELQYRHVEHGMLRAKNIPDLHWFFGVMVDWLRDTGALSVGMIGGGDIIGGMHNSKFKHGIIRRVCNVFFCDVDQPMDFRGTMNEDIVAYTRAGFLGKLCMSHMNIAALEPPTQSVKGGMTEIYLECGTYMKAFYPLMMNPGAVKISCFGETYTRIHHRITGDSMYVKVLNEKWRKPRDE